MNNQMFFSSVSLSALLAQIRHGNDVTRRCARLQCVDFGTFAVPGLLTLLADEQADVRHAAVNALGMIADPTAGPALRQIIASEPDIYTRGQAVVALTHCLGAEAIPDLISLLDNHERGRQAVDKRLCDYAARGLIEIGPPEMRALVETWAISQLDRQDWRDKVAGLFMLQKIGTLNCLPAVKQALNDHEYAPIDWWYKADGYRVSNFAAETLWKIFKWDIAEMLELWALERLKSKSWWVRYNAIYLLDRVGTERCIPTLLEIMSKRIDFDGYHLRSLGEKAAHVLNCLRNINRIPFTPEQQALFEERLKLYRPPDKKAES